MEEKIEDEEFEFEWGSSEKAPQSSRRRIAER